MQTQLLNYEFMGREFFKILSALPVTLKIVIITMFFSLIFSFFIAQVRVNKVKVGSQLASFYVSFIRGTPLLVQLYLVYYGIPKFLNYMNETVGWNVDVTKIPKVLIVYIAFILNTSAYMSETFRGAIMAVDKGQIEAGLSIGMNKWQITKRIILPQAFIIALPNLGNSFIGIIKSSSLAFTVAVTELMGKAKVVGAEGLNFFEVYIIVSCIYWVLCIMVERITYYLENKLRISNK